MHIQRLANFGPELFAIGGGRFCLKLNSCCADGPCESDKVLDTLRRYRDHMETKKTVLIDETGPRLCGGWMTVGSHVTA